MRCENDYSRHCEARLPAGRQAQQATRQSMTTLGTNCRILVKLNSNSLRLCPCLATNPGHQCRRIRSSRPTAKKRPRNDVHLMGNLL
ncbi:MAG: hypothetical protein ACI9CF_000140 [Candidatus Omnitrophota bacterium]|jgi:hypothetical protein